LESITDPILQSFLKRIGDNKIKPLEIILFGSRARGQAEPYSDYDLLLIFSEKNSNLLNKIREVEWDCMELHQAVIASIVYTATEWEERKQSPLGWNIQREGEKIA